MRDFSVWLYFVQDEQMAGILFSVGIVIFMITVYGAVLAGGMSLQRRQRENLADDVEIIVNDDGYDVMTSATSARTDHSDHSEE